MGFCLCFYLTLMDCLILFGEGIEDGLVLLLRLRMVLGSVVRRIVLVWHCLLRIPLILIVLLLFLRRGLLIIG